MTAQVQLFSRLGRYALRTAAILAGADERMTGKALAERTGVPHAYQAKVLRLLVEAEILTAKRGHHGGFSLALQPQSVRIADVLAAVGALPTAGACVFGWGECSSIDPCELHSSWSDLSERVRSWAEGTTLSEIASAT